MANKRATCITSGDTPAFERGLRDMGYTDIEELSRKTPDGDVVVYVYQHEDTGNLMVLLTLSETHFLFKQTDIAPIFDSGDDEAKFHSKNPKFAF